jgi:hypothetical protein
LPQQLTLRRVSDHLLIRGRHSRSVVVCRKTRIASGFTERANSSKNDPNAGLIFKTLVLNTTNQKGRLLC